MIIFIYSLTQSPECIPALFQIYHSATDLAIKQSAGILVRKKIGQFWDKLGQQIQEIIKTNVLQHVATDPTPVLRNCAADIIGAIAKITVPKGQWPDLMSFLKQCTESENAQFRNVGIKLLGDIAEPLLESDAGKALKGSFLVTVGNSLVNPGNPLDVKTTAIYALSKLIRFVDNDKDLVAFRDGYLPEFMKTLEACIVESDTNTVVTCYETFNDILELVNKQCAINSISYELFFCL